MGQTFLILAILLALATFVVVWAASLAEDARRKRAADDAQTAADFDEPTRAEVEHMYGPRVMYGPQDVVDAHRLPLSQSETARRIRARIADNECARFRRELDEWPGGAA